MGVSLNAWVVARQHDLQGLTSCARLHYVDDRDCCLLGTGAQIALRFGAFMDAGVNDNPQQKHERRQTKQQPWG